MSNPGLCSALRGLVEAERLAHAAAGAALGEAAVAAAGRVRAALLDAAGAWTPPEAPGLTAAEAERHRAAALAGTLEAALRGAVEPERAALLLSRAPRGQRLDALAEAVDLLASTLPIASSGSMQAQVAPLAHEAALRAPHALDHALAWASGGPVAIAALRAGGLTVQQAGAARDWLTARLPPLDPGPLLAWAAADGASLLDAFDAHLRALESSP